MPDELNPDPSGTPAPPPVQPAPPPLQQPMYPQQGYYQPQPQNDAMQALIPTRNPASLVSYYVGVASLICVFAPILSPISIIYGVKAMRAIKEQPGLPGKGHAITGFILSGLGLAAFIAMVALIILAK